MKIALLGATRGTGKQVLDQALERGYQVVALARDATKLPSHPELTVVQGDAKNIADVEKVVSGTDGVISCIGSSTIGVADRLVSSCTTATIEAMKKAGVKRLVLLSVEGAGENAPFPTKVFGAAMKLFSPGAYDTVILDKNRAEELIRAAGLDYTFVRPPGLKDGPKREYRAFDAAPMLASPFITRAAVAAFMLDELTANEWVQKPVVLRQ